jgi:branched-chain amino acid transport system permease protein
LRAGRVVGVREPHVAGPRQSLLGVVALAATAAVAVNLIHGTLLTAAASGLSIGIVGLSLVLLTGYGGQISLCQYSFLGLGAWVFAKVASHGNPAGLLVVAAVGAVVGAIIALPALRLQGLYLALSTLAFGQLAYYMFFLEPKFMGRSSLKVHRLALPFVSVASDKANVFMLAIVFGLFALVVLAIRRGPFGRLLGAMKDSSAACATLGLNLTVTKMGVFALSTAIAAVGGALYGASEHSVNGQQFQYVFSLLLLLIVYVWGIKTPSGALLGGLVLAFIPLLEVHLPERFRVVSYLGTGIAIVALSRNPNGVMGQVSAAWDNVRTRVAADRGAPAKVASRPREEVATVAAAAN